MNTTSASLLDRLRQTADPAAWERFVRLYTPLLCHWARRLGLASQDVEDLVQDVFAVLLRKLPEFRGVLNDSAGRARWSGTHNVYSLARGFVYGQPCFTLEAWQKRNDSDKGSLVVASAYLEPRLWRMRSGQPRRPD
jgi:hypothetical protein